MNTEMIVLLNIHAIRLRRFYETAWHNLSAKCIVALPTEAKVCLRNGCFITTYCFLDSLTSGVSVAVRIRHVYCRVNTKSFVQFKNIFSVIMY